MLSFISRWVVGESGGDDASTEEEEEDDDFRVSAPTGLVRGLHIVHDATDNTFKGVPAQWRDSIPNAAVEDDQVTSILGLLR
jgi:hypothetical protein